MAKDLTVSRIDRQNILNNDLAVQEIQEKSGIQGILWENKIYITRRCMLIARTFKSSLLQRWSAHLWQNGMAEARSGIMNEG